jgi:uncharacterized protein
MAAIPERLVNFECYGGAGGVRLLGMTDVELPKFEAMSETIMGAGIAGEYDSPVLGHFKAMQVKLKWRTVTALGMGLLAPVQHVLDLRGSIQNQDPALGVLGTQRVRIEVRGQMKVYEPGKFEPGKPMEAAADVEVATIRVTIGAVKVVELDKFNYIFVVNGVDYLRTVRTDLGI